MEASHYASAMGARSNCVQTLELNLNDTRHRTAGNEVETGRSANGVLVPSDR